MKMNSGTEDTDLRLPRPRAELFAHGADVGVRGIAHSREGAFEQAAIALSGVVTDVANIHAQKVVEVDCEAPDDALLLVDWLNALIYRMAVDCMLFGRFCVHLDGHRLHAEVWGEPVDRARHAPAVEPKGATYTALKVTCAPDGIWTAQCVVDV
jgi:tRNA nucleotidyltransferase (CCA-adding enzyme)